MNQKIIYRLPGRVRVSADRLHPTWTVLDLADVLAIDRSNSQRRITDWLKKGWVSKVSDAKRGRIGERALYQFNDLYLKSYFQITDE
jgi:DNA-binding MarR family transcriptional regulator